MVPEPTGSSSSQGPAAPCRSSGAYGRTDDMMGQVFASLVPTVAAAESAIGRKSLGTTFKVTLDGRIQAIQEESQQFPNPNEVVPPESNEQQRLLRISLRICGTVVESLPMARCAPKCEKTVQALLCRNLNVKSATLTNATSSRRIRFQDDLVTKFYTLVEERIQYQDYFFLLDQPLTLGFGHTKYGYEVESDEEAGPETTQTRFFLHK
ncbi:unnamed protein product [Microthlaspi erraticum]|uniref:ATP synthase protein MI25 n=1 Tax=Microthlaspi erraticum TaxID=1685480 RepID=A0A6D2JSE3_9BRAS|nr:unnamed protein product [Microthlaspi erraticum]